MIMIWALFAVVAAASTERLHQVQNAVRILHNLTILQWDDELAVDAERWAVALLPRSPGGLSHDNHSQNLAWSGGPNWPAEKAVCLWLRSEGHRATMLSDEVTAAGCGIARGDGLGTVVVCNYHPTPSGIEYNQTNICHI